MTQATRRRAALAVTSVAVMGPLMPAARAAPLEQIGGWVLNCPQSVPGATPGSEPCLMRLNQRFFDKAGITGDLEVEAHGKSLVPVIALRGLSTEVLMAAAMAGKAEASIQFDGGAREVLNCAPGVAGYFCSPNDAATQRLAARLPAARSATVRVSVSMAGMNPLPVQEKSLGLSGTKDALARLRTAGPSQVPSPMTAFGPASPAGMMEMVDKALKAAGYPNGIADLRARLAKYMRK
jgi:hypothetical protein